MIDRTMGGGEDEGRARAVVYCLVPSDLAGRLHDSLRRHFRDDPSVEVVVDHRVLERRAGEDRREPKAQAPEPDRRRVRSVTGRRGGERRATLVEATGMPALPRSARRWSDRILFVERLEPSGLSAEDDDTARLVMRIQSGDREAFGLLYLRYFQRVYGYFSVVLRNAHEAEEATQQVFTAVLESLPRYERRAQPFRAWLFTIARRAGLDRLEKSQRLDIVDPAQIAQQIEAEDQTPEDLTALDWLTDRELVLLMDRLPLAQRQVLTLRYMLDLPYGDVATILDRSLDDVRMLHHRARRFLEKRLVALGRGPAVMRRDRARGLGRQATVMRARRWALVKRGLVAGQRGL